MFRVVCTGTQNQKPETHTLPMIRINLLPVRQMKKRLRTRNEVLALIASLVVLFVLLGMTAWGLNQQVDSLKQDVSKLKAEKAKYNAIIKEMKRLEADKNKLTAKIDVIKQLKFKSQVTVHLLDEIASATPPDSIWLQSLKQSGTSVALTAIALDNTRIANYMDSLTASPYFADARLGNSSLTDVAGQKLKKFSLNLQVQIPKRSPSDSNQGTSK